VAWPCIPPKNANELRRSFEIIINGRGCYFGTSHSLIQADDLPPDAADAEEDGDVEDGEAEADLPPRGERHVAGAQV
jgi:hypothetical protein